MPNVMDSLFKVIKSDAEYEAALEAIELLLDRDPASGTLDAQRLELLTLLVQDYEAKVVPAELPDPIEAIRFRMEQQGLRQKDLIPFIGSRSKVSEVLSRKRPLTLTMIRALNQGLGIPAEVLLQEANQDMTEGEADLEWDRFPVREMIRRGWIRGINSSEEVANKAGDLIRRFFEPIGGVQAVPVLYRRTEHVRSGQVVDRYALAAWTARVMSRALEKVPPVEYTPGSVTSEFLQEVARLSWSEHGPALAAEFLFAHGIPLVVEPALPRTRLDGAAILLDVARPVIGMTIRYDRLDNFWFCLLHELAHIALHFTGSNATDFFDDLDAEPGADPREFEADAAAGEALIPEAEWRVSPASMLRTSSAVRHLANKLRVHPAIIAGRIRHEYRDFRVLGELIGQGEVRRHFSTVHWD